MNELQRLTNRIKMAKFFADGEGDQRYYDVDLWSSGRCKICSWTGAIVRYERWGMVWCGCDVQPEHAFIVDNWLYNNYQAYQLTHGLLDQIMVDNVI